jgi:hypothetical protein
MAIFSQIDDLVTDLPLSPIFFNNFMCFYEATWLANRPFDFKPIFYNRYVDDTFLVF